MTWRGIYAFVGGVGVVANPKFTDSNGNFGYIWQELPVIPSDRPDLTEPVNVDRALVEYSHAGIIIGTKYLTTRGRWSIRFQAITESMVLALQFFFGKAYIRFYATADSASYKEVYITNAFTPIWQPAGRYNLTLELRQYSP